MRDMEYLMEADLKYFEKKAEQGEALIIYVDPDKLAGMDLQAFFKGKQEITDDMLMHFLEDNQAVITEVAKQNAAVLAENAELQKKIQELEKEMQTNPVRTAARIEKALAGMEADEAAGSFIAEALNAGLTDAELVALLEADLNERDRRVLMEVFMLRKSEVKI